MRIEAKRAIAAGVAGTTVMTVVGASGAPLTGTPPMNPADILAGAPGDTAGLGMFGPVPERPAAAG